MLCPSSGDLHNVPASDAINQMPGKIIRSGKIFSETICISASESQFLTLWRPHRHKLLIYSAQGNANQRAIKTAKFSLCERSSLFRDQRQRESDFSHLKKSSDAQIICDLWQRHKKQKQTHTRLALLT
jgi:hypothetical protein